MPAFIEVVQPLLVLKRIHGGKEAIVFIGRQLLRSNQTLEWFYDQFLSRSNMSEDIAL